jgi:hypothetical protein
MENRTLLRGALGATVATGIGSLYYGNLSYGAGERHPSNFFLDLFSTYIDDGYHSADTSHYGDTSTILGVATVVFLASAAAIAYRKYQEQNNLKDAKSA